MQDINVEVESMRQRLQAILTRLGRADVEDEGFDQETLSEMRCLMRRLRENGFNVASVRRGHNLVIQIEPMQVDRTSHP